MTERFPKQEESKQELLSTEEKAHAAEAWVEVALGSGHSLETVETLTDEAFKRWLFESLSDEVVEFIKQSEITVDDALAQEIIATTDTRERSELEHSYLQKIQNAIDTFARTYREREEVVKWNSCPSLMKETGSFNCVGSTLVAMQFLDKAGIKSHIGNPVEHIVNVVQLSDGSTVYADFLNGPNTLKEVESVYEEIEGVPILVLNDKDIDYRYVPIFTNEEIVAPVLGNLHDMTTDEDERSKNIAATFVDKHAPHFEQVDFGELEEMLYPEHGAVAKSTVMKEEKARIRQKRELEKPFREYRRTLSEEQITMLVSEIKDKRQQIKEYILEKDESLFSQFSEELVGYVKVIEQTISSAKKSSSSKKQIYRKAFLTQLYQYI